MNKSYLMQWFVWEHLQNEQLKQIVKSFYDLAEKIDLLFSNNPAKTEALTKLCESKDWACRAYMYNAEIQTWPQQTAEAVTANGFGYTFTDLGNVKEKVAELTAQIKESYTAAYVDKLREEIAQLKEENEKKKAKEE